MTAIATNREVSQLAVSDRLVRLASRSNRVPTGLLDRGPLFTFLTLDGARRSNDHRETQAASPKWREEISYRSKATDKCSRQAGLDRFRKILFAWRRVSH